MIKRYESVNSMKRSYDDGHTFHVSGESCVDKTGYHPTLDIGESSGYVSEPIYDFPDGIDTGSRVEMMCRNKGLDMSELQAMRKIAQENVDASINRFNKKDKSEKLYDTIMKLNKDNVGGMNNEAAME